jgi:uncharacterized membrane protein
MTSVRRSLNYILKKLGGQFLAGILIIVPIGITILILVWLFNSIDNILQPVIIHIWGHRIPGVGFAVIVILIYVAGVIADNLIGKRLISFIEKYLLQKIPVIGQFYQGVKQIMESFSKSKNNQFMQVVLVEFPRKGVRTIGFITNEMSGQTGEKLFNIFVPHSPSPTTGFLQIMKEDEFVRTKISIEDGIKMVVSAGGYVPLDMKPPEAPPD